jgi:hypothetical protein
MSSGMAPPSNEIFAESISSAFRAGLVDDGSSLEQDPEAVVDLRGEPGEIVYIDFH